MQSKADAAANRQVWGDLTREFEVKAKKKGSLHVDSDFSKVSYQFEYESDFDERGLFYWVGSKGGTVPYHNPHNSGHLLAAMSDVHKGDPANIVEHSPLGFPNYTRNAENSWFSVDIGRHRKFLPTMYTLRHGGAGRGNAIRNWELQGKVLESDDWAILRVHQNDDKVSEERGATATWRLDVTPPSGGGYRFFRVVQTGKNSGGNDCLFCSGFELYGILTVFSYL